MPHPTPSPVTAEFQTAFGLCRATLSDGKLVELHLSPEISNTAPPAPDFLPIADAINRYAAGDFSAITSLPLAPVGTPFQQSVWTALRNLPPGEPVSYTRLAELCGMPTAVRAVASAVAANKIALAIPCHRVVRMGGAVGQFRWGARLKAQLLDLERTACAQALVA